MARIIFIELLVILLPFAVYGAWRAWQDGAAAIKAGEEAAAQSLRRDTPVLLLAVIGGALALVTFLLMAVLQPGAGEEPDFYQPNPRPVLTPDQPYEDPDADQP